MAKMSIANVRAAPRQRGRAAAFKRLAGAVLRLNELRNASELQDFLIDEVTALSGAERVLLVLDAPQGLHIAG